MGFRKVGASYNKVTDHKGIFMYPPTILCCDHQQPAAWNGDTSSKGSENKNLKKKSVNRRKDSIGASPSLISRLYYMCKYHKTKKKQVMFPCGPWFTTGWGDAEPESQHLWLPSGTAGDPAKD